MSADFFKQYEDRPYFDYFTAEIATTADDNWGNPNSLKGIFHELTHRKRQAAVALRDEVGSRLDTLTDETFPWPNVKAKSGDGNVDGDSWVDVGLLKYLGYQVGKDGLPRIDRQSILRGVYSGSIPNVNSPEYMNEWGAPDSGMRLQKLANCLAAFCRNGKRRKGSAPTAAITDWEEDLSWLKGQFYSGRYDFVWPDTTET